jgi:hypothetical protein
MYALFGNHWTLHLPILSWATCCDSKHSPGRNGTIYTTKTYKGITIDRCCGKVVCLPTLFQKKDWYDINSLLLKSTFSVSEPLNIVSGVCQYCLRELYVIPTNINTTRANIALHLSSCSNYKIHFLRLWSHDIFHFVFPCFLVIW